MRRIIRVQCLCSNSSFELPFTRQIFRFSSRSKSSKFSQFRKTPEPDLKDQSEANPVNSLFKEIAETLGAVDGIIPCQTSSGIPVNKEADVRGDELRKQFKRCTQGVCRNAEVSKVSTDTSMLLVLEDAQIGDVNDTDISPMVHEVTGIIRSEYGGVSMEERLQLLQLRFEPEFVEKVLKRCFKVPHLAFRFFNWVKGKNGFLPTAKTYNVMVYIAGEAKEFWLVDNLVEEMAESSCEDDIKTWTILISQYVKVNLTSNALLFFDKRMRSGVEPDLKVYKILIRSICNTGKAEIALKFYKQMVQRDMDLAIHLYKLLLNCMAKSGNVDAVNLAADDMIKISQIPERDVYACVLKSYCVAGRIREALELMRDLNNKEIQLDYEYFEIFLRGLSRAGRIAYALEIVKIMKKRNCTDCKVYEIIINGYLRRKEVFKALDLFEGMKESGLLPTTSTYTGLMQHLFRLNKYEEGCRMYDEMLERGIKMDSVATMAIVVGHICQNHITEAWDVLKTMENHGIKPTWKSYSIFIKQLCKVSRTDESFKVLHKIQVAKVFIHGEIFEQVISCMKKRGEIDNIQKIKQTSRTSRLCSLEEEASLNVVSRAKDLQLESIHKQPEQVRQDFHLVKPLSNNYKEQDLRQICRILSSSEDWFLIQEALEKCHFEYTPEVVTEILSNCSVPSNAALHFFSWVGRHIGYRHTTETYNIAMKISGRGKDFKHMRSLFYEMKRNRCLITPETWGIMIMQYGRTGLTGIALKIFGEMKANGYKPTGGTYKYLVISLCGRKGRKVDKAIKIFKEMIHAGFVPDGELVGTYLGCLCDVGKLLEARKCRDSLCKVGFTIPLSNSFYVRALCRAGRLEEALSLVDEFGAKQCTLDQYAYASLVHGLLRKGQFEEAQAKVDSMKRAGILPTVHVYTSFIVHFFKEKHAERALEIFNKMQQEGCVPTIVTYSALIRGYMNIGKFSDAWNVFHRLRLKGPRPDFKTYSMFIHCLCKAGNSEEALQLISEMMDAGIVPSTVNFRTVVFGLNREGKPNLARTVLQQKWDLVRRRKFLM